MTRLTKITMFAYLQIAYMLFVFFAMFIYNVYTFKFDSQSNLSSYIFPCFRYRI